MLNQTEVSKGTYGAKVHSFSHISPRAEIMKRVESGDYTLDDKGRDQCELDMFKEFGGEGDFWASVWSYYHANNWAACVRDVQSRASLKERISLAEKNRREREKSLLQTKEEIHQKINDYLIVTLDMTMPNGKRLADCTKDEVLKIGGFYSRIMKLIADKMKDDQKVCDVWSCNQLETLK